MSRLLFGLSRLPRRHRVTAGADTIGSLLLCHPQVTVVQARLAARRLILRLKQVGNLGHVTLCHRLFNNWADGKAYFVIVRCMLRASDHSPNLLILIHT